MTDVTLTDVSRLVSAIGKILQLHDGDPCRGCGRAQPCATVAILSEPKLIASTTAVMNLVRETADELRREQRPRLSVIRAESSQERRRGRG